MTRIGRNAPCPCGSGKKYKHCCIHEPTTALLDENAPSSEQLQRTLASRGVRHVERRPGLAREIMGPLPDEPFASIEEAQAFMQARAQAHNMAPAPGFDGLSPHAMHHLLRDPYGPSDVLDVHPRRATVPGSHEVPLLAWIDLLHDLIGEAGAKATAKGNLPRSIARLVADRLHTNTGPNLGFADQLYEPDEIRREDQVDGLAYVREILQLAGVLSLDGGTWRLTNHAHTLRTNADLAGMYGDLFETATQRLDWFHGTDRPMFTLLPRTWPFLLRLLQRYGNEPKPTFFYADALIEAFPAFLDEAIEWGHTANRDEDPDEIKRIARNIVRRSVQFFAFQRFSEPLGLVTLTPSEEDSALPWSTNYVAEATQLAREVVTFHH